MSDTQNIWHQGERYDELAQHIQWRNACLLASLPRQKPVPRVFELGCGTGLLTEEILRRGLAQELTALDLSPSMIAVAQAKPTLQTVDFKCGSFLDLDIPARYDLVISNAVIHWLYPRYAEAFAKIVSMLTDGGMAYLALAGQSAEAQRFDRSIESLAAFHFRGRPFQSFSARRASAECIVGLAASCGLILEDQFLLERWVTLPAAAYVEWFVASGVGWEVSADEVPELTKRLHQRFGEDHLKVGHWTRFAILRKGAGGA